MTSCILISHRSLPNRENYSFECQGEKEIRLGTQMNTYFVERRRMKPTTILPVVFEDKESAVVPAVVHDAKSKMNRKTKRNSIS